MNPARLERAGGGWVVHRRPQSPAVLPSPFAGTALGLAAFVLRRPALYIKETLQMGIMNLVEAAARFAAAAADIEVAKRAALEEACQLVEERAKSLIGVPHAEWPPLQPETIARKDGVNSPLLETGEMRDSIHHTVVDSSHGYVGSNEDKAVWQELGTSRGIPPRSFLAWARALKARPLRMWLKEQSAGR
jgi:hypothetical protein